MVRALPWIIWTIAVSAIAIFVWLVTRTGFAH
jgi:hypothetical protein